MKRNVFNYVVFAIVVLAFAVYLAKIVWPSAPFFVETISPSRFRLLGLISTLGCLGLAAFHALSSAARFDRSEAARLPWILLGSWFTLWTLGYLDLTAFALATGDANRVAPVPSLGDVAFFIGYLPLFAAEVRFISLYRASGLPVGTSRDHLVIAAIATAAAGFVSYLLLAPIARSDLPFAARFVNIAYPALDLAAAIPTLVMLRIALAFRPGKVWKVWAALLAGFLFTALADLATASVWPNEAILVDPWSHALYLLGYFFMAYGAKLQYELLTDAG